MTPQRGNEQSPGWVRHCDGFWGLCVGNTVESCGEERAGVGGWEVKARGGKQQDSKNMIIHWKVLSKGVIRTDLFFLKDSSDSSEEGEIGWTSLEVDRPISGCNNPGRSLMSSSWGAHGKINVRSHYKLRTMQK